MPKIRVLVVDDSVVVRRLVSDVLDADPALEVAGVAPNGRVALSKIPLVNPDIVILDVEMPELDGLQTLRAIRQTNAKTPVIMFSALTERGAVTTLNALAAGANDYVTKPTQVRDVAEAKAQVRDSLIPKIKAFCRGAAALPSATAGAKAAATSRTAQRSSRRVDVVAIGVSTGGPNALAQLMPVFPAGFAVPIVMVQHMPPVFTKSLADRLSSLSALDVYEGAEGDCLKPGGAWIAPGGYHMVLEREADVVRIKTHQGPLENACRPAVDVLFRSVAAVYGENVLAVILTGMGRDGLRGCEHILEAGGRVLAQDEATCVVWGMPGAVARAGLAERQLPLNEIGYEIMRRVRRDRPVSSRGPRLAAS